MHPLKKDGTPMHPKTPILNGYKYFAINVTIDQRKKLKKDTDLLKELTGKPKRILLMEMIEERLDKELNKMERRINEQGDHNINTA